MHVVVIGAGLGGLAAAVAADRVGHTVTVLERTPELRGGGAGVGIMPNGVLALDALGLGGPVRELASLDEGCGMWDRHGSPLLTADLAAVQEQAGAPVVVVRRSWLHGLLSDALAPTTVLTDVPVTALYDAGDHVELRTGGGPVHADAVIVADGAHSGLRGTLLPDHPGLEGTGEYAARGIAPAPPPGVELAVGELVDHRTGDRFGCLPLADGGVHWFATWHGPSPVDPVERHGWLRERRAGWHPAAVALIDATPADAVHVVEIQQLVTPLPTLAVNRVVLLGDAGHAMTPDFGQGACQAFEDAVTVGSVLDGATVADVPAAFREYDARRRPRADAVLRKSRRMHRLLGLTGWRGRLRDALLRRVPARLAMRSIAAKHRYPEQQQGQRRRMASSAGLGAP
jgi:2-polyprenyl-6-methoxyphenol hydroxylase-like FAD-dependent oxidoreductase